MKTSRVSDEEIDEIIKKISNNSSLNSISPFILMKICTGYQTLVDNCCDKSLDYLEFKPDIKDFTENKKEVKPFNPLECGFEKMEDKNLEHYVWFKYINNKRYEICHIYNDEYDIAIFTQDDITLKHCLIEDRKFEKYLIERIKIPNHQFGVDLLRNLGVIE